MAFHSQEEMKHSVSSTDEFNSYTDTFKQIRRKTRERNFHEIRKAFSKTHLWLNAEEEKELKQLYPLLLDVQVHWEKKVKILEEIILDIKEEKLQILLLHYMSQLFHNLNSPQELIYATHCNIFIYHQLHGNLQQEDLVRVEITHQKHLLSLLVGLSSHAKFYQEFNLKNFANRMFELLDHHSAYIATSALWVLNHTLIADRKIISKTRIMNKLNQFLARDIKLPKLPQEMKIYMWSFYLICQRMPLDEHEPDTLEQIITKGIITIKQLYLSLPSDFSLLQQLIILLYIFTEGADARSKLVIDLDILPQVFKCISYPHKDIKVHSLGIIGNITGCAHSIASIVYHNDSFMEQLVNQFFIASEEKVLKFLLWIFKNIMCAGSYEVELLHESKILTRAAQLMADVKQTATIRHAAYINIASAIQKGTDIVVRRIIEELNVFELLIETLAQKHQGTLLLKHCLEGLIESVKRIKSFPLEDYNELESKLKELGVTSVVGKLTTHQSTVVYNRANQLLGMLEGEGEEDPEGSGKKIEI